MILVDGAGLRLSSVSDGLMSESGGDWEVPANYLARGIETNQKSCSKRSRFSMYTLRTIVKVCKILSWRLPSRFVATVLEGDPSSKIVGKLEQHRNRLLVGRREKEESSK